MPKPKIGDKIPTWFSGSDDGLSTVLEVQPYRGNFPYLFQWTVKATAPRTQRGWMELAVQEGECQDPNSLNGEQQCI